MLDMAFGLTAKYVMPVPFNSICYPNWTFVDAGLDLGVRSLSTSPPTGNRYVSILV